MKIIKNAFLFLPILITSILPSYALPSNSIHSPYIQNNGAVVPLEEAIAARNGKITSVKGSKNNYIIDMPKNKYTVNLKSSQSVSGMVFSIFPDNIKVNISFSSAQPNKKIYFDNNYLSAITDKNGNAEVRDFYPEPGLHRIELKEKNNVTARVKLVIKAKSFIQCIGKQKMKCSITT